MELGITLLMSFLHVEVRKYIEIALYLYLILITFSYYFGFVLAFFVELRRGQLLQEQEDFLKSFVCV